MVLSDLEAACTLYQAGWPENLIPTMVAIGHPESGLDTKATNSQTVDGTHRAKGWLQVVDFPDRTAQWDLYDPVQNAQAAYSVYQSQGLKAWEVWPNPASSHLPKIQASLLHWSPSQCSHTNKPAMPNTGNDPTGISAAVQKLTGSITSGMQIYLGVAVVAVGILLIVMHTVPGKSLIRATAVGKVLAML